MSFIKSSFVRSIVNSDTTVENTEFLPLSTTLVDGPSGDFAVECVTRGES